MFAVIVTGAPGSGKTVSATALSDALIVAEVEHASGDVDELAWSFPFPDLAGRCEHLRVWAAAHRAAGRDLLLVAEVIESREHLGDVLSAVGADATEEVAAFLEELACRGRVLQMAERADSDPVEEHRSALVVAELAEEREALFVHPMRPFVLARQPERPGVAASRARP